MNKKLIIIIIAAGIVLLAGILWFAWQADAAKLEKLNGFAQCIADSGAKFYGAFWCTHCQNQKAMFNTTFSSAAGKLPYIECSTPDGNSQLQVCKDAAVRGYPTWKFTDGTVLEGEVSLEALAQKTNCQAPN